MKKIILPVLAGCLLATACTTPGTRTAIGAGGGAAVGALAGAIIANNGGKTPVAPSALNKLDKKYTAKHVIIPMPNFIPKL